MKKRICVISGSRAEYGLLKFLIIKLKKSSIFETKLVITGTHLSKDHGLTLKEIVYKRLFSNFFYCTIRALSSK